MTSREFRESLLRRANRANIALPPSILGPLETYYRLLSRWNERINLTALPLDPLSDEATDRLFLEPAAAARFAPATPGRWFDLGSGGGSPAIPLKLIRPEFKLTMVESKARKAAFLREAVRTLELEGAGVENSRVADLARLRDHRHAGGLVTVRAVRADQPLFRAAADLLMAGGRLLLFTSDEHQPAPLPRKFELEQSARLGVGAPSYLAVLRRKTSRVPRGTNPLTP